jgi:hypothetical protein
MSKQTSPLDNVTIAAPCSAGWDNMVGDERARFCGQCDQNVYNISAMSKEDAEQLIAGAEGRLCIRYYRRADGTIMTRNCPVGLRALKRRLSRIASATATAVISFLTGILAVTGWRERPSVQGASTIVLTAAAKVLAKATEDFTWANPTMGTYAMPERPRGKVEVGEIIAREYWVEGKARIKERRSGISPKRRR